MSMRNDPGDGLTSSITDIKHALMSMRDDPEEDLALKRKWRRNYAAEEADQMMHSTIQATENGRQPLANREESHNQLMQAVEKQPSSITAYQDGMTALDSLVTEQMQEINVLGEQLSFYRNENISQSEKIALQNTQLVRLQAHINGLEEQLSQLDTQNTDGIRSEAIRKADELVKRAVADSERIMSQATEQRDRLIAAYRAAYYSALQFKQDLAAQFKNIEQELDESIDVLQSVNNNHLSLNQIKKNSGPASQQENTP